MMQESDRNRKKIKKEKKNPKQKTGNRKGKVRTWKENCL